MRLILIGVCLTLMACGNSVEKIETKWVDETEKTFDAIIPEGNYRSRYKAVHALSGPQLCEAVLPLQRLDWIFIPMLEPVGVIRWKRHPQNYLLSDLTSNVNIAVDRLYDELTQKTETCSKAAGRNYGSKPWDDVGCSIVAVRAVCGDEFVSDANYDRLLEIDKERKVYQQAMSSKMARAAVFGSANNTNRTPIVIPPIQPPVSTGVFCTGTSSGGFSTLSCN